MTEDNSHCTKTAHVKREGRESEEGKKKKKRESKGKKIKKPHHKRPRCLDGRCAALLRDAPECAEVMVPACLAYTHTHIPGMQKLATSHELPLPSTLREARGIQTPGSPP